MTYILSAIVAITAFGLIVLLSAQIELLREMRQLREIVGVEDRTTEVDLGAASGGVASDFGFSLQNGVALILSDHCGSCRSIAQRLDGAVPKDLQILIQGSDSVSSELVQTWDLGSNVIYDPDGQVCKQLGVKATPTGILVDDGLLIAATSVPSSRQLTALLKERRRAKVKA